MTLKELSVKEALQLLAEKYPKPVKGWFWDDDITEKILSEFIGIEESKTQFVNDDSDPYLHFAIEVPDEYRYMTQQEHDIWLVTIGYKNHQMRCKDGNWYIPFNLDCDIVNNCEYRTIQEIDGKIVYGEPQEFKIKV